MTAANTAAQLALSDFPSHARDKLRYADTDRQGHINNAIFASLFETGRVEFLYSKERALHDTDCAFVIANLSIDFLDELHWPGEVSIGTRVSKIGRSSITLEQAIFQGDKCAARSTSVIVHVDTQARRAKALSERAIHLLSALQVPPTSGESAPA